MLASICPEQASLKEEDKDGKTVFSACFCPDGATQIQKEFPQLAGALKWFSQLEAKKSKTFDPVL